MAFIFCEDVWVASFRDRQNPEAVIFPGNLRPKVLICSGIFVCLLCALISGFLFSSRWELAADILLLLLTVAFLISAWPRDVMTDQYGVMSFWLARTRRLRIQWTDVGAVVEGEERGAGLAKALGLSYETLAIVSASNGQRITHTPRHPDRARFLHELALHGAPLPLPKS